MENFRYWLKMKSLGNGWIVAMTMYLVCKKQQLGKSKRKTLKSTWFYWGKKILQLEVRKIDPGLLTLLTKAFKTNKRNVILHIRNWKHWKCLVEGGKGVYISVILEMLDTLAESLHVKNQLRRKLESKNSLRRRCWSRGSTNWIGG